MKGVTIMNSRERVLCSLSHTQPDRAPTDFGAVWEVWEKLFKHFKTKDYESILNELKVDCRWIGPTYVGPNTTVFTDESYETWGGSVARTVKNEYGSYQEISKYALDVIETIEDIDHLLKLPELKYYDFSSIIEGSKLHEDKFIITGNASTFHYPTLIRNMEDLLVDMIVSPELVHHIIKRCFDWHMQYHERILEAGKGRIDAMQIADDFSTQSDLMFSVDMFREFFKQPMKKYVELCKSYGAIPYLHCCGSVYKLLPDLIDIGIEILDPIQTTATNMNPDRLKAEFGKHLTFHGAAETQSILPNGTPDEVRKNAVQLVEILGKDGGYILGPCHSIQADVPVENILALFDLSNR